MNAAISVSSAALPEFCRDNGIRRLAVFGSALRSDFRPDSDIDLLVEFLPGRTPNLLGMAQMERELSSLFAGRKIDLRTPQDLSRYFRDEVVAAAEVCYEAGHSRLALPANLKRPRKSASSDPSRVINPTASERRNTMKKTDQVRVWHMLDASEQAMAFAHGRTRADLDADRMLTLALVKAVEIIGEAASQLTEHTRDMLPDVPWSNIINMRNRLVHAYFDIDIDVLWDAVQVSIPELVDRLESLPPEYNRPS